MAVAFWPCKEVVSLLLLLAVLPLFFSAPTPHSQTLTTITSLQTITTESAATTTHVITSQIVKTTVLTESLTTTSYYPRAKTLYKTSMLLLERTPVGYGCVYHHVAFTAKENEVFVANLTSNLPATFFLFSNEAYKAWKPTHYCEVQNTLDEAWQVQQYSSRLTIPSDGTYHLLLENWSRENGIRVSFVAQVVGLVTESSSAVTTSTLLTSHSTRTETYPTTMTRVLTSVWTEEVGLLEQNTLLIGAAAVVVVALLGVLALRSRRK
jgi:hypothetical protein